MTKLPAGTILALSAGAGVLAAPFSLVAVPASASTDCGPGTEVLSGICEQVFATPGEFSFSAPAGVTKVSAVIVGAGGGAAVYGGTDGSYGGGGGEVVFVDSVEVSGTYSVTVGAGGGEAIPFADASNGGDSALGLTVASGGFGATFEYGGGASGRGDAGSNIDDLLGAGGGAAGATTDCVGGAGLTASVASAGSSLFPAEGSEAVLGVGGNCLGVTPIAFLGSAGSGGSVSGDPVLAEAGEDGAVIIRWAGNPLPDTGLSVRPWMIDTGVALAAVGALCTSSLLRTRRRGRHSA